MLCQECQKRPATLHFTKINNGEKTEVHLCEHCAGEKGDFFMFNQSPSLTINSLLAGLFNVQPSFQQEQQNKDYQANELVQCDKCGMTFSQFLKVGRFGCAHCYEVFETQLTPILRRLHGGNWKHSGKIPQRSGGTFHLKKKIDILKETLQTLVVNEEFEKAAEIRDEIRSIEKLMQEGGN
ncbi:UvrB/UvrC motif-containing protein [Caldibacillus lycopersici]|uniref:UvrB/UvrC motif-containing protein n=1 Tax=Perspicuibacillus lycopersici TaxID=1325689 RepID=A0AAE3IXM5_9BACI|nr:UvrB/UvrC motif-containing protein [Perspicuibacillus lycopersici]MCU9615259.1 UvrB/UvrC motif-containing protein [Perspicuibacillus lycopersici]